MLANFAFGYIYVILLVYVLFAALPGFIAASRGHQNTLAIFICGLFGTWLAGIPWFVALIWSLTTVTKPVNVSVNTAQQQWYVPAAIGTTTPISPVKPTPKDNSRHTICGLCGSKLKIKPNSRLKRGDRAKCPKCQALVEIL